MKLIRFYNLNDNNLAVKVKCEKIKKIFKKESIFDALFLKLCIILKILQKTYYFTQKLCTETAINNALPKKIKDL